MRTTRLVIALSLALAPAAAVAGPGDGATGSATGSATASASVKVSITADVSAPGKAYAAAGDKAYALYRAINCYAPSGNNSCGGSDVDKSVRKAWFQRLKGDYAKSSWATK